MIQSCDVGSLPYTDKPEKLLKGANDFAAKLTNDSSMFFEQAIVAAFLDKLKAGISVPAFPQFRDMNEMFLTALNGLGKIESGYIEAGRLTVKSGCAGIPEVKAIERNAREIEGQTGNSFQLRVCITGPYTLASFFPYRTGQTYRQFGDVLSEIVEENIFFVKHGKVSLVAVDEPLFGVVDDPLIDRGTEERETLLATWESIMRKASSKNVETCIHLHCTSDDLFWAIKSLRIVESHVDDPLYEMKTTKQHLEKEDKLLKASIAITDFDRLIMEKLDSNVKEKAIVDAWQNISKGKSNPDAFLENANVMKKRLTKIIERFGAERVVLAGPECGLRGFPTYTSAIACLKRVSTAVNSIKKL